MIDTHNREVIGDKVEWKSIGICFSSISRSSYSGSRGHLLSAPSTGKIFFSNQIPLKTCSSVIADQSLECPPGLTFGKIRDGDCFCRRWMCHNPTFTVGKKCVLKYYYEICSQIFEAPLIKISLFFTTKCIFKHNKKSYSVNVFIQHCC